MMENLFSKVLDYSIKHQLFKTRDTIIIGFSGGPDSTALLAFFKSVQAAHQLTLVCVYINHHWRQESEQEAVWCKQVCNDYAIECHIVSVKPLIEHIKNNGSQEERARCARRTIFASLAKQYNAHAIALAHHSDDQIETFFIRLIRGAHLEGLKGMQSKCGMYIRPFLNVTKQELLTYLTKNNLAYCYDRSNDDKAFLRNSIRHDLIRQAQTIDKRFSHNCLRSINALGQAHSYLQHSLDKEWLMLTTEVSKGMNIEFWHTLHPFARNAHLLRLLLNAGVQVKPSEALIKEIERFINNKKSKRHAIATCTLHKSKGFLTIHS